MLYVHLSACIGFALPPQGSHPVPQTAAETGARHLQVVLAGSQKVDVLSCLVGFFPVTLVTFLEFPRPKYHRAVQSLAGL